MRWLERLGLADRANRKVEELSKGNQQKVQFVTSLLHNPPLLIMDEPFSGLDPVNQLLFQEVFAELREQGKAVIFSTHQMDQAEKLSDSLCLINQGRVVLGGSVREVKQRYGTNTLHVEFEGDGEFIRSAPGVLRAMVYANAAEIDLAPGAKISSLVSELNGRLSLTKLELREPSLQSIFIQVVGEPAGVEKGDEWGAGSPAGVGSGVLPSRNVRAPGISPADSGRHGGGGIAGGDSRVPGVGGEKGGARP
jgi:ABC-2 type transport system ATP-binding protein